MRFIVLICGLLMSVTAFGQSSPGLYQGQVPSASQWNTYFQNKIDVNGGSASAAIVTANSTTQTLAEWLASVAPLASPTFTGTVNGAAAIFTGNLTSSARVGSTLAVLGTDLTNGNLRLGSTTGSTTPYVDFINNNAVGMRFILNAPTTLSILAGNTTNVGSFSSAGFATTGLTASGNASVTGTTTLTGLINAGTGIVYSGGTVSVATTPRFMNDFFNIGGTAPVGSARWFIGSNSDTMNMLSSGVVNSPFLYINRAFGGTGAYGPRMAQTNILNAATAIDSGNSGAGYVTTASWFQGNANVGGTGTTLATGALGSGYAFYPQVVLYPGATNWNAISLGEGDIGITPTIQLMTIGGTNVNGDVVTATFTSASISGSPVSVTYTVGTSNTNLNICNGLSAAVTANSALQSAHVTAQTANGASGCNFAWPAQNTVAVAVASSGSGTFALGGAVSGATAYQKVGFSITRNADGASSVANDFRDAALSIDDDPGPVTFTSGQWRNGITFGGGTGGGWPIAYNGTMMGAYQPYIFQTNYSAPLPSPSAKYGIDWHLVNFSQAGGASLLLPGFSVGGTGVVSVAGSTITPSSAGLAVDAAGRIGSGNPAITAGGGGGAGSASGNYFVGDIVTDAFGGQYLVSTVNTSTGAVTGLTTLVQPSVPGAAPSNPLSLGGGSGPGTGLAINVTWVAATTLSLQPSGGAMKGGSGMFTANGAVATTMTSLGPTGSHTTVQEWLTITDASGVVRYIPAY